MPALALTYLDVLRVHREHIWTGGDFVGWAGVLVGFMVYAVAIIAIGYGIRALLQRAASRSLVYLPHCLAAVVVLGIIYWAGIAIRPSVFAGAALLFILGAVLSEIGNAFNPILVRRLWLAAGCALLAGIAAMIAANHFWFLSVERVRLVTVAALAYTAAVLAASGLAVFAWRDTKTLLLMAIVAVALPFVAFVVPEGASEREGQPACLLLITTDAMRADACSVYGGSAETPTFQAMADNGALFTQCQSLSPWTLPSMVGLFGSCHPPEVPPGGSPEEWLPALASVRIPADTPTLAELLREQGYATAGLTANSLLQGQNGMLRGFDMTRVFGHRTPVSIGLFRQLPMLDALCSALVPALAPQRPVDTSRILTRYATRFISAHRGEPFFLWLHYMDPHTAYNPPKRYRTGKGPRPVFCNADARWGWADYPKDETTGDILLSPDEQAYAESLYLGEVRYVDACVGRLLEALEQGGARHNTIVCVHADHGEEFWEHRRYGHGHALYQELVRVPLILQGPGIQPVEAESPVSAIDVMPTLASLLSVDVPGAWQGTSLYPLLTGERPISQRPCFIGGTNPFVRLEPEVAVVQGRWKLIEKPLSGERLLFDVQADPAERESRYPEEPQAAAQLQSLLEEWAGGPARTEAPSPEDPQEIIEQLQQVGYL